MPGAFSKALKENLFLQPVAQAILDYKKRMDEIEGRKKLMQLMDTVNKTVDKNYAQIPEQKASYLDKGFLNPVSQNGVDTAPTNQLNEQPLPFNLRTNVPQSDPNLQTPDVFSQLNSKVKIGENIAGFDPVNNPEDRRTAEDRTRSSFADLMKNYILDPTVDQTKLAQIIELAKSRVPSTPVKDEYDYKEIGGELVRVNKRTGETILVYGKKQAKDDKEISTYTGDDDYQYTTMKRDDGTTYEIKSTNKVKKSAGNNIKIDLGTKEEKWKDVADLIVETKNPTFVVEEENANGDLVNVVKQKTSEERKRDKEKLYYTAFGKLVPSAKVWYDKEIKGKWGREDMSQHDFLAEIRQALTPDKNGKTELTGEAAQDLLDFAAYRPEIFGNLSTKSYKK